MNHETPIPDVYIETLERIDLKQSTRVNPAYPYVVPLLGLIVLTDQEVNGKPYIVPDEFEDAIAEFSRSIKANGRWVYTHRQNYEVVNEL